MTEILMWPFGIFTTMVGSEKAWCLQCGEILLLGPFLFLFWLLWPSTETCSYHFLGHSNEWSECFVYDVCTFAVNCIILLVGFNLLVPVHPLKGASLFLYLFKSCFSLEAVARLMIFISFAYVSVFTVFTIVYHSWLCSLAAVFIAWQTGTLVQHYRYHDLRYYPAFEKMHKVERRKNFAKKFQEKLTTMRNEGDSAAVTFGDKVCSTIITEHRQPANPFITSTIDNLETAYDMYDEQGKEAFEAWLGSDNHDAILEADQDDSSENNGNPQVRNDVLTVSKEEHSEEQEYVSFCAYDDV